MVGAMSESIRFYSELFGNEPAVRKPDYAKWMLDDPRVNLRDLNAPFNPLELITWAFRSASRMKSSVGMKAQLVAADAKIVQEDEQTMLLRRSDKYWVTDPPRGSRGRTFHTLSSIPIY